MSTDHTQPDGYIDDYRKFGLSRAFKEMISGAVKAKEVLKTALSNLPLNPNAPGFDWGRAKILYDQKEEAHEKAEKELNAIESYKAIVERELARCKENLEVLARDRQQVRTGEVRTHYSEIINRHGQQYRTVVEQRKVLLDLIAALRGLLQESRSKQLPRDRSAASEPVPDRLPPAPPGRNPNPPDEGRDARSGETCIHYGHPSGWHGGGGAVPGTGLPNGQSKL